MSATATGMKTRRASPCGVCCWRFLTPFTCRQGVPTAYATPQRSPLGLDFIKDVAYCYGDLQASPVTSHLCSSQYLLHGFRMINQTVIPSSRRLSECALYLARDIETTVVNA